MLTSNLPSRRTILGASGAAALSSILMPWRPKADDILIASEVPPDHPVRITPVDAMEDCRVFVEMTILPHQLNAAWNAPIGHTLHGVSGFMVRNLGNGAFTVGLTGTRR